MADDDARDAEFRSRLTPEQYAVTRQGATERAFTGQFWDHHEDGTYTCVCCGEPLFDSETKFESGTGWPSFTRPASDGRRGGTRRHEPRHGAHRGGVLQVRRPPGPRVPGRPRPDRAALLHQLRVARLRGPGGARDLSPALIGGLVALAVAGAAGAPAAPAPAPSAASLTPAQLAGQRMVYGFPGTVPPADLVRRIRRGEAGAVILLRPNVPSPAAARALTRRLQAIPRPAAVNVPLLVMIDQEGGLVRRLDGPPSRSAADLGRAGPRAARAAGRATGRFLAAAGVNVNLAPVADVARPGSFLAATGRTFGRSPARVAGATVAFSAGLQDGGVVPAAKHFPGLGAAIRSTDEGPVRLSVPAADLRRVEPAPVPGPDRAPRSPW